MKLIKITEQIRRDFWGVLECEDCGHRQNLSGGYDDRNYHDNVIPNIKCKSCGNSRNDLGVKGEITPTKYAAWEVV